MKDKLSHQNQGRRLNLRPTREENDLVVPLSMALRSFQSEPIVRFWVPGAPANYGRVSGSLAGSLPLFPPTTVSDWSIKYQSVFKEYRVLHILVKVRATQSGAAGTANGMHVAWFDEQSPGTPSLTEAIQTTSKLRPNDITNPRSVYQMAWTPQDVRDYELQPTIATGTSYQPVNFKIYSDTPNFANNLSTSTNQLLVQPWYYIEFRGIQPF